MADPVAIFGVVLGGAGMITGAASLVYVRTHSRAALRHSESAERLALMESNIAMFARFRQTRDSFLKFPNLQKEWRESWPHLAQLFDDCGGLESYFAVREAMDTLQDVYFLRKQRAISDQYWHMWTRTFFRVYTGMPTFLRVFEFAAKEGYLHPEFVAFYQRAIDGKELPDPALTS